MFCFGESKRECGVQLRPCLLLRPQAMMSAISDSFVTQLQPHVGLHADGHGQLFPHLGEQAQNSGSMPPGWSVSGLS
jgi:hypothetical protein